MTPRLGTLALCLCSLSLIACGNRPEDTGAWLGPVEPIDAPSGAGSRFPHLAVSPDGAVAVMSWLEPAANSGFRLRYASLADDRRWSPAASVAEGTDWFINWADFPSVVPVSPTTWAAHWLQQKPGSVYSYDVRMSVSQDGGRQWSEPFTPHDDGTPTEHGFVSIASVGGEPYAVWLDGRHTAGEGHGHDGHGAGGAMTLRGGSVGAPGTGNDREIDGRVCDCCQTDLAVTPDALVLVYRDRSEDETRDILSARYANGHWSGPVPVHADGWRIDGCPVNGPAIDARGDQVAVAWFTAPDQPRLRLAFSTNGGRSFGAPIEVASGTAVGRVDVVLLADGRAVVSWLAEPRGASAAIHAQPFTAIGADGPPVIVSSTDVARASGFPQMVRVGDRLVFAWTEHAAVPQIRTASARLN